MNDNIVYVLLRYAVRKARRVNPQYGPYRENIWTQTCSGNQKISIMCTWHSIEIFPLLSTESGHFLVFRLNYCHKIGEDNTILLVVICFCTRQHMFEKLTGRSAWVYCPLLYIACSSLTHDSVIVVILVPSIERFYVACWMSPCIAFIVWQCILSVRD